MAQLLSLCLQAVNGSLDGIIDTVSAKHPLGLYLSTLKVGGMSVMLGVPDESMELPTFNIIMRKHCLDTFFYYSETPMVISDTVHAYTHGHAKMLLGFWVAPGT